MKHNDIQAQYFSDYFNIDKSDPNRDAYALLYHVLKTNNLITPWKIAKVGICCVIAETETEDEHSVSFELTWPNKSNLPSQHSRYQAGIENALLKSGAYINE